MKNPFLSTKFIAAVLSSILSAVCIGVLDLDLATTSLIVAPLAAYVPFQAVSDLRRPQFGPDEVAKLKALATKE